MKGQERACEMHGGTKPGRSWAALKRRGAEFRQTTTWNATIWKKQEGDPDRWVQPPALGKDITRPQAQEVLVCGPEGREKDYKEPATRAASHQSCGMCWLEGYTGRHMNPPRHRGHNPQLSSCGGWGQLPSSQPLGSLPKTRDPSCHQVKAHPTINPICCLAAVNFKQQLWLWDQASLHRGGHRISMARISGWSALCHSVSSKAVRIQGAF